MLDAHHRLGGQRTRALERDLAVGAQVQHYLQRLLLDEAAHVARGQRLEVVGAQQHAGYDRAGVDGAVQGQPLRRVVLSAHPLIVPGARRSATRPAARLWPGRQPRRFADRLDAFASLLELAEANPYTIRAYRRAAETIRGAAVPVAELVEAGRVRELRGVGPGIESRLRELVDTGQIAELAELERELSPELVGLGRYLGLSARRSIEVARALEIHTAEEFRDAAAEGRLRAVPGIGPKTEARLLGALAREDEPEPARGLLLPRAGELVEGIAAALGGEAAGDVRRWRDSCHDLAVVCAAEDPGPVLAAFAQLPQIVAVVAQTSRRAMGVTVDGVAVELVVAARASFGSALLRATGSPAYVAALEPLARRPRRSRGVPLPGSPVVPAGAARGGIRRRTPGAARAAPDPGRPARAHHLVRRPAERGGDGPRRPRTRL